MAVNIKKMQDKFSKAYFNFIPETFVLPDQFPDFELQFEAIENKNKISNISHLYGGGSVEGG